MRIQSFPNPMDKGTVNDLGNYGNYLAPAWLEGFTAGVLGFVCRGFAGTAEPVRFCSISLQPRLNLRFEGSGVISVGARSGSPTSNMASLRRGPSWGVPCSRSYPTLPKKAQI